MQMETFYNGTWVVYGISRQLVPIVLYRLEI